jgi:FKBP-type peptidyl-prolyl cis-trans isomerase SlpA
MSRVLADSHVTLHYRLALAVDGGQREVATTFDGRPATVQLGIGQLAPPLEARLIGMNAGDSAVFELAAGEAYGARSAELVQRLSRAAFEAHAEPDAEYRPGDIVEFNAPDGARFAGVLKAQGPNGVVIDFNHPLAGLPLVFSVRIIGVL